MTATLFTALLPVLLLMGVGFAMRKVGWIQPEADASLMRLVVNLLYPALILSLILGNPALREAANLVIPPLVGIVTTVTGFAIAYAAARYFGLHESNQKRTFSFTTGIYNYGYIPIPLIALLWDSREIAGVLLVHNLGVEVTIWTIGIVIVSGTTMRGAWKRILNPPVLALTIGLTLNALGLGENLPVFAESSIAMLAACAIPLGLMLAGCTLADLVKGGAWKGQWMITAGACIIRLGVLPLLFLLLARYGPFSLELKKVIVIQAAMPAGMFPLVVARHFGGDSGVALRVVAGTTLLSILTIPFWIGLGMHWLDLAAG